ncbi:hypothetical protein EJ110_NYTH08659 [Nymphaea thermarum]|nr:hypothetical protein EJ110_NYTH08659 [Nymphaea thermarum]
MWKILDMYFNTINLYVSGSDFFVKLSERRKRRKSLQQEKGEHVPGDTTIADETHQQLKMLKDNLSSGEENGLRGQIQMPDRSDHSNNSSPAKAINLRLEAKKAAEEDEVCGNLDSVKFINQWMHSWYIQNPANDKISSHNDDHEWIEDDDAVNDMYGIAPKNILLLTGPIGSGKSAAIYACAKEQGQCI